jgi:hypothetical protein
VEGRVVRAVWVGWVRVVGWVVAAGVEVGEREEAEDWAA